MIQRVRDFGQVFQHRLDIEVSCRPCGRVVVFAAQDFIWHLRAGAQIEERTWHCSACGKGVARARYLPRGLVKAEDRAKWTPPEGMRRAR